MTIDCAFFGFLAGDAEPRVSQAGKNWVRLRVGVGRDEDIQWISLAVFGKAAEAAAELKKGDRIYCEGNIRLDTWTGNDGVEPATAWRSHRSESTRTHNIGRNKPKRERADGEPRQAEPALNDQIPF